MSLGLQSTKRRIASVNSTKKITKAMQLVATAKLKSLKKNVIATSQYADEVSLMMSLLSQNIDSKDFDELFKVSGEQTHAKLFIIVTSSLGLCGGYNYNVYKEIQDKINKENDYLFTIGSKGTAYFKNRGYNVNDLFINMLNNFDYYKVDLLAKEVLSYYRSGKVDEIYLVYTHYKNQITFIPTTISLFPMKKVGIDNSNFTRKERDLIFEPNVSSIMKIVLPLYFKSILFARLSESITSEYATRRNAMESATDNAEEIVGKLQIEFNKARQAAITQEITEVVGGANAQN